MLSRDYQRRGEDRRVRAKQPWVPGAIVLNAPKAGDTFPVAAPYVRDRAVLKA